MTMILIDKNHGESTYFYNGIYDSLSTYALVALFLEPPQNFIPIEIIILF